METRSWWEEIGSVNSTYTDIWALTYCYWVVDVKTRGAGLDVIQEQNNLINGFRKEIYVGRLISGSWILWDMIHCVM